jgi:hypothetical protein
MQCAMQTTNKQTSWFVQVTRSLKPIGGFQIGPMNLDNIPVIQRNKQKDLGFSGMFNYEVIQVFILARIWISRLKTLELA